MKVIVQGKDAVLNFLEDETLRRTNEKPGVYSLYRDDAGTLILAVEGWTFLGSGNLSLGANVLEVVDGGVMKAERPS